VVQFAGRATRLSVTVTVPRLPTMGFGAPPGVVLPGPGSAVGGTEMGSSALVTSNVGAVSPYVGRPPGLEVVLVPPLASGAPWAVAADAEIGVGMTPSAAPVLMAAATNLRMVFPLQGCPDGSGRRPGPITKPAVSLLRLRRVHESH
jgi:hypothetical protein